MIICKAPLVEIIKFKKSFLKKYTSKNGPMIIAIRSIKIIPFLATLNATAKINFCFQ